MPHSTEDDHAMDEDDQIARFLNIGGTGAGVGPV